MRRIRRGAKALVAISALSAWSACGEDAPPPAPASVEFPLIVSATDDGGEGVAKVPVLLDGKPVGYTDKDGKFSATLTDQPGKTVVLTLGLVEGYRYTQDAPMINEPLRTKPDVNGGLSGLPLRLNAKMESTEVEALVWVKAKCDDTVDAAACANLEVKLGDETVATTDEHGHAHFVTRSSPNKKITVTIATPAYSSDTPNSFKLEPRSPEYELQLGRKAGVFMVDGSFTNGLEDTKSKKSTRRVKRRPSRVKTAPKKVTPKKTTPKKAPPKKAPPKKKNNDTIDLF